MNVMFCLLTESKYAVVLFTSAHLHEENVDGF